MPLPPPRPRPPHTWSNHPCKPDSEEEGWYHHGTHEELRINYGGGRSHWGVVGRHGRLGRGEGCRKEEQMEGRMAVMEDGVCVDGAIVE
ncbi:hypothetical protein G7K_6671-t1 [Saitoella complicata NRRL Y-17804]|uniref:Uncharacterized protein n=1 Tax=Saitoella complicata (strain BCRC 22490 / CBS 7301 / JCM 7358 / NBRC 10748 / NRRL Y-17804) TaxID=698492 RepID=A0A0E9NS51_SAICN|nr:hypothetical protein G7K_6671-t1 [Saitoella complicata NRRL Y-17804]